ncbi:MAG: TonB-dependent receptor [Myxococcaceae bacterium]|nr:TonB-dependent receptor [Myxococcaceae bacterium]
MVSSRAAALVAAGLLAALTPASAVAEGDRDASMATAPAGASSDTETHTLPPVVVPRPPPDPSAPAPESPLRREPAGSISVIDAKAHRAEAVVAADLVTAAPGVQLQDRGGLLQSKTISVRGASSNGVLVLLDGVPLSGAGGAVDLAQIPVAIVDRFELIRGGGAQYGSGALGGVLNVVTRAPQDGPSVSGAVTWGSFGTEMGSVTATGDLLGGAGVVIVHGAHTDGTFRYQRDPTPLDDDASTVTALRQNNDVGQAGALVRYRRALGSDANRLEVMGELSFDDRGIAGDVQNPTPDRRMQSQRLIGSAALTHAFAEGGEVRMRAYGRRERSTFEGFFGPPLQTLLSGGLEVEGRRLLADVHGLTARAEVGYDGLETAAQSSSPQWLRLSASAADEILLRDGTISLVPGLRVDRNGPFTAFSPKLGASVLLPAGLTLRANAGQAHRTPSFVELYVVQGTVLPNPNLRPERALFADLGVERSSDVWRMGATGFYSLYEDLISYELYLGQSARPYNFSAARAMGAELEAALHPSALWSATASYTLTFSQNLRDDPRYYLQELPYRPRHKLSARLSGGVDWLSGRVELDAQSEQFVNRTGTTSVPARAFVNLGATCRLWRAPEVRLSLDLKNLLDAQGWDYAGYPLPGRAAYLTLSFSLDAGNGEGKT